MDRIEDEEMNKLKAIKENWLPILMFIVAALFFGLNAAWAGGKHHNDTEQVINIEYQQLQTTESVATQITKNSISGIALAAAAGQHNYKATNQLQWSVAGAFVGENDDSAASFGLAKQVGKVFVSGNFTSDGTNSLVGVSASGTF